MTMARHSGGCRIEALYWRIDAFDVRMCFHLLPLSLSYLRLPLPSSNLSPKFRYHVLTCVGFFCCTVPHTLQNRVTLCISSPLWITFRKLICLHFSRATENGQR